MIEIRRLLVLREVADQGTVAAAARTLHLTPSAVSQALAALSRETGVVLTEPDGRRLRLTDAAHTLLDHAHRLLADLERAEADLARYARGRLGPVRIGAFPSALGRIAAPAARALARAEPTTEVTCTEIGERACFAALARREIDVAVSAEYPGAPQESGPRFHRRPLLVDRMDLLLAADHPLAGARRLPLERLAGADWALGLPGTACHEVVVNACTVAGFTPRARHLSSDWTAVSSLVAETGVVALLPRTAQIGLPAGVVVVPVEGSRPARHVFAATRLGAETAPTVAAALRALASVAALLAIEPAATPDGRAAGG